MEGSLQGGQRGSEDIPHQGGGLVEPRGGHLPDLPPEAPQCPPLCGLGQQGHGDADAALAHHRVLRARLPLRLPPDARPGRSRGPASLPHGHVWPQPPALGDCREGGEAGHRPQGLEDEEHLGQRGRCVLHRRSGTGAEVRPGERQRGGVAEQARGDATLPGPRGHHGDDRDEEFRVVQESGHVLLWAGDVGGGQERDLWW